MEDCDPERNYVFMKHMRLKFNYSSFKCISDYRYSLGLHKICILKKTSSKKE